MPKSPRHTAQLPRCLRSPAGCQEVTFVFRAKLTTEDHNIPNQAGGGGGEKGGSEEAF